jgi:hypothetical protein
MVELHQQLANFQEDQNSDTIEALLHSWNDVSTELASSPDPSDGLYFFSFISPPLPLFSSTHRPSCSIILIHLQKSIIKRNRLQMRLQRIQSPYQPAHCVCT